MVYSAKRQRKNQYLPRYQGHYASLINSNRTCARRLRKSHIDGKRTRSYRRICRRDIRARHLRHRRRGPNRRHPGWEHRRDVRRREPRLEAQSRVCLRPERSSSRGTPSTSPFGAGSACGLAQERPRSGGCTLGVSPDGLSRRVGRYISHRCHVRGRVAVCGSGGCGRVADATSTVRGA